MQIDHVVVLMLENRSFDAVLGRLYPDDSGFDGVPSGATNSWHAAGRVETIPAWSSAGMSAHIATIPDPDPGELFADINTQLFGTAGPAPGAVASMAGFVDNYMAQPPAAGDPPRRPDAVMHGFLPEQLPVLSTLARSFGVSDRWFASAPCQTWPNRFFVHTGTAGGWVNNEPVHWYYPMPTIYRRLARAGRRWRVYFHDLPQSALLRDLWCGIPWHFRLFERDFRADAAAGRLPSYSFIEPRYFNGPDGTPPNDQHPPHDVAHGEQLIATIYNALRTGPGWPRTLFIITYDEHGGIWDHVPPPKAAPPGGPYGDGFAFDRYGVRVPAVIVSPYIPPGSIVRPAGTTPFDHCSIIATLQRLFDPGLPLTPRVAAAPDLLPALSLPAPSNEGPEHVEALPVQTTRAAARPLNHHQRALRHPKAFPARIAGLFARMH